MTAKAAKASTKKPKTTKAKPSAAVIKKPNVNEKTPASPKAALRTWNIRLGVVLVLLAIAVVVVGGSATLPITTQYLAKDTLASEAAGHEVVATATRHLWDVHVSWTVAKFLVIFAAVYLLAATLLRAKYEAWLDRGVNGLRWVGLGLGGGTVATTVAMLSGVSDVSTLTLVFGSIALAALLAGVAEFVGSGRQVRRLLAAGAVVAVVLPWLVLPRTLGGSLMYNGNMPTYMYYLYATVTLLIIAVVTATAMRLKQRGKWADTFYTERMFMMLGFLVAVAPALQIFAGVLQP